MVEKEPEEGKSFCDIERSANDNDFNMEGDLTSGGEHTIQYTDDVLQNCTPEACIMLLTNVTPINSIQIFKKENDKQV